MAEQLSNRTNGNGKLVAICAAVGLLVGMGVVTPFALNYRSSMQRAQNEAVQAAALAERNKQEAIALEEQKAEMRENLGQAEKTITTLKDDLTARGSALAALKQTDEAKSKEVDTLKADVQKKSAAMTELDERLKGARADVENATKENTELMSRVNALRGEVSRMSETVQVQGAEIARLVEEVKKEEAAKVAALAEAAQQQRRAEVAEVRVQESHRELMTLAPVRIEERRATKKGRKIGEKSGVPFAAALDPIGDAFQGIGEGLFGKSGPVILVAVYKDGHEETLDPSDVNRWKERGIRVVKLNNRA